MEDIEDMFVGEAKPQTEVRRPFKRKVDRNKPSSKSSWSEPQA